MKIKVGYFVLDKVRGTEENTRDGGKKDDKLPGGMITKDISQNGAALNNNTGGHYLF